MGKVVEHFVLPLEPANGAFLKEQARYSKYIRELFIYTKASPSVYRFVKVCDLFKKLVSAARRHPLDHEIENRMWFRACVSLLSDDPHQGVEDDASYFSYSEAEYDEMVAAIKPLVQNLRKWASDEVPEDLDDMRFYEGVAKGIMEDFPVVNRAMPGEPDDIEEFEFLNHTFPQNTEYGGHEFKNNLFDSVSRFFTVRIPKLADVDIELKESEEALLKECESHPHPWPGKKGEVPKKAENVIESPLGTAIRLLEEFLPAYEAGTCGFDVWRLLDMMSAVVRQCISHGSSGLFAIPAFVKALYLFQSAGGTSGELHLRGMAESAWTRFNRALVSYFKMFCQMATGKRLPDLGAWLSKNSELTQSVEATDESPNADKYFGIRQDVCDGLFLLCENIARECYDTSWDCASMYVGVFPETLRQSLLPQIREDTASLEDCYERVYDDLKSALQSDAAPMDKYARVANVVAKGVRDANQSGDFKLPEQRWLQEGLGFLATNPRGAVSFANADACCYSSKEVQWIESCLVPLFSALRIWGEDNADVYSNYSNLALQIQTSIKGNTVWLGANETILIRQMIFCEESAGHFVFKPTSIVGWLNRMPRLKTPARLVDPSLVGLGAKKQDVRPQVEVVAVPPPQETQVGKFGDPPSEPDPDKDADWREFYGQTIQRFHITKDGSKIIDLSSEDKESECGLITYGTVTDKAVGARLELSFFFRKFKAAAAHPELMKDPEYYFKFCKGRTGRQSLRQLKAQKDGVYPIDDFVLDCWEPKDKGTAKNGHPVNPSGLWRIGLKSKYGEWPAKKPSHKSLVEQACML